MECIKVPNTNAREIKIISDFDHLSMLEKLSADFFGILQDYSQDISDCKLTKDTLYRSLVEYCKEEEALPPPPPPTEDFSSNIVPMEDGEVSNTNALFPAGEIEFISDFDHQREKAEILSYLKLFGIELGCADKHESPAEVVTSDSDFDIQREKSEILSMLKLSGIELGCADKHESPAEVVTSDSTRKQQKKASQTSYDPLEKLSADFFGILQDYSQDKAFRCDEMDQLVKYISDCELTKDTLHQSLVEYCKEEEALPPPPAPTEDFSSNIVPMEDGEVSNTNALFPAGEIKFISDFDHQREKSEILSMLKLYGIELGCADKHESPAEVVTSDSDIQHEKYEILSMLKMSGIELGENCGESLVETRPSADKHESPAEVVTSDSARVQQKRKRSPILDDPFRKEDLDVVFGTSMLQYKELPCDDMEHVRLCSALCEKQAMKKRRFLMVDDQET